MLTHPKSVALSDAKRLSHVALKTFFNITRMWRCTSHDEIILLGQPAKSTFYKWKQGQSELILPKDTLERISYIFGIYSALRLLFPTEVQAHTWPNKPNMTFQGKSALDIMRAGNVVDLAVVRRYLDGMRG